MFPAMSSLDGLVLCGSPTMLLYDHKHIIESEAGVQQGDPLGPLYFCCGIMPPVNEINVCVLSLASFSLSIFGYWQTMTF